GHGLVGRLGREGHDAARCESSDRRELRAHPPLEPDRHGRAAAAVQGRPERAVAGPDGQGDVRDHRPERRRGESSHGRRDTRNGRADQVRSSGAHRHAERAGVLPARRHPALRAAPAGVFEQSSLTERRAMTEHVRITVDNAVMRITLARPEKKNALTQAMYVAVGEALTRAESDPTVRVVLIDSEGDAFTAGNDIADFAAIAM